MRCNDRQAQALARLEREATPDWQEFRGLLAQELDTLKVSLVSCADDRLLRQLQGRAQMLNELLELFAAAVKR